MLLLSTKTTATELATEAGNRVVLSYKMSKITGSNDWLDQMERQHARVTTLPLESRLLFYTTVLSECELFAATSLHFVDVVGDDAAALERHLKALETLPQFSSMDADHRRRISFWANHLEAN